MMTMHNIILLLCRSASIALGLLAAYYWLWASTVTVTDSDERYDPHFDFVVNDPNHEADDINFFPTAKEQSKFNRIAAIYTAPTQIKAIRMRNG